MLDGLHPIPKSDYPFLQVYPVYAADRIQSLYSESVNAKETYSKCRLKMLKLLGREHLSAFSMWYPCGSAYSKLLVEEGKGAFVSLQHVVSMWQYLYDHQNKKN